jgi:hypothetical protein
MNDIGGWLWAVMDIVFVAALAAAMVWASLSRRRAGGARPSTDALKASNEPRRTGRYGRWQDWAILALAIWLCVSPAILVPSTPPGEAALSNTIIVAVLLAALALAAVYRLDAPQEWAVIVGALWVFLSPWLLGFSGLQGAAWNHWIVAVLILALAGWELLALRHMPPMRSDPERRH